MFLNYAMDITEKSYSWGAVQTPLTRSLPLLPTARGYYDCNPGYRTRRSGMPEFLLLATLEGCGRLCYEGESYELDAGSCMLIDCGRFQEYSTYRDFWRFYYCHFVGQSAGLLYGLITDKRSVAFRPARFAELTDSLRQLLLLERIDTTEKAMAGCSLAMTALSLLYASGGTAGSCAADAAVAYIRAHYAEKVTLEDLAASAYLSKFHFAKVFKRHTGTNPGEYLAAYRVARAKDLLINTRKSVEEISEACGYLNPSSFIRCFRAHTGTTPHRFRNQ